ncbi:diguanylate cyclase [Thalassotalea ganghwensis]
MRCIYLFFVLTFLSFSIAAAGDEPIPYYSALDNDIEQIANKYGLDTKETLKQLKAIELRALDSNADDLAYFLGYRCYLETLLPDLNEFNKTLEFIEQKILEMGRHPSLLAVREHCKGQASWAKKDYEQYWLELEKAYQFARKSASPILRYWINIEYSSHMLQVSRHTEVVEAAQVAKEIAIKNGDLYREATANTNLALSEAELGFYDDALANNQAAIDYEKKFYPDSPNLLILYLNRGYILLEDNRNDEADEIYQKAIKMAVESNDQYSVITALTNLSSIAIRRGDFDLATRHAERALDISKALNNENSIAFSESLLASAYAYTGKIEQAKVLYQRAISYFKKVKDRDALGNNYYGWASAMADVGEYQEAHQALKNYVEIQQMAFDEERKSRMHHTRSLFQSAEKDRKIQALTETNIRKQITLENQSLQKKIFFLAAVTIATVLFLLFMLYRKSQALNVKLSGLNTKLDHQRFIDPLTKCFNRRYFDHKVVESLSKLSLGGYSLFALDLDKFKQINDTYGHAAGDQVLVDFAKRITQVVRENDSLIRLGGEEFLLVVNQLTEEQANRLALKLLDIIARDPIVYQEHEIKLTLSIGVSAIKSTPISVTEINEYLEFADMALYQAKSAGRNRAIRAVNQQGELSFVDIG